jgi:hypothetical protein
MQLIIHCRFALKAVCEGVYHSHIQMLGRVSFAYSNAWACIIRIFKCLGVHHSHIQMLGHVSFAYSNALACVNTSPTNYLHTCPYMHKYMHYYS